MIVLFDLDDTLIVEDAAAPTHPWRRRGAGRARREPPSRAGHQRRELPAAQKLRASGLEDRFEAVIVSEDLGAGKPDPAPFEAALEALGADPQDAWMGGDSLERDVRGAIAAGLRAAWLNPDGGSGDHAPQIRSLAELEALL